MARVFTALIVLFVPDCTDALACNYNDSAEETDNTLCEYPEPGYNCDGSCISDVDGDGVCDGIFEKSSAKDLHALPLTAAFCWRTRRTTVALR